MDAKPKISCVPNGPYRLINKVELRRSSGQAFDTAAGAASLCRCGGSSKKPFCDGTHGKIGFKDDKLADPAKDKRETYIGKGITIFDNRAICAHAGFCTDELAAVFRHKEKPWIHPDSADVQRIIATIEKCPSGALSYAAEKPPQRAPMVTVTDNGPYAITGGIELMGAKTGEHYTLCRCGGSKNKPFCDGTHWYINFKDPEK